MQRQSSLRTLWRFVRPEPEELVFYLLAIIGFIGIAAYKVAVQGEVGSTSQSLIGSLSSGRDTLYSFFNTNDSWGRFFLFGVWFLIGTVVYIIAWSIVTVLVDVSKDIKISSSFVHPSSFHKSDYWLAIVTRAVLRGSAGITLIFYGVFWLAAFAPVWLKTFRAVFEYGSNTQSLMDALSALIGIAVSLHIAAMLLRIALLRAHYSYED